MSEPDERHCPWCGDVLEQRDDEPDGNFQNRTFCNKTHSSRWTAEDKRGKRK